MKIRTNEKCKYQDCTGTYYANGLCKRHYDRSRKDRVLDAPFRTTENQVRFDDLIAYISLYNKHGNIIGEFMIDEKRWIEIKSLKWWRSKNGYICSNGKKGKQTILLHRVLTDCPDGMVVDHINHNKSDNRMCNLRVCTNSTNMLNRKKLSRSNTGELGITKNSRDYYIIEIDNRYIGCSKDFGKAKEMRNNALKNSRYKEYGII